MNRASAEAPDPAALLRLFVALAIVLLPFNALPYFRSIFGEMAYEGAFYPLLLGTVWWAAATVGRSRVALPTHASARLLVVFVIWVFVSGIINAPELAEMITKGRTGIEKFLLQSVLVVFTLVSSVFMYNALVRSHAVLYQVRRWMLASFLICGAYSILEIGRLLGNADCAEVLLYIDRSIRDPDNLLAYTDLGRLRSVSGEASWFAMYCGLVTPWILSYLFTAERLKVWYVPLLVYLLVLITLTWSRAAYVMTALQLAMFVAGASLITRDPIMRKRGRAMATVAVILFVGTAGLTVMIFDEKVFMQRSLIDIVSSLFDADNLSNVARMGSQVAAMQMGVDNPVFGVGLGQYAFHMSGYVPNWALGNLQIARWMSSSPDMPWAPVQGIYSRIAAELGFTGLLIWIAVWASVVHGVCARMRRAEPDANGERILGLALLVSILGVLLASFNADSLRFFGYWIALAVAWAYIDQAGDTKWRAA